MFDPEKDFYPDADKVLALPTKIAIIAWDILRETIDKNTIFLARLIFAENEEKGELTPEFVRIIANSEIPERKFLYIIIQDAAIYSLGEYCMENNLMLSPEEIEKMNL